LAAQTPAALLNMSERDFEAAKELRTASAQSAFGFTPTMALELAEMMNSSERVPYGLIIACASSVGQIKENLGDNELMRKIEDVFDLSTSDKLSRRPTVNFSAVRLIGMLYVAWFKDVVPLFMKLNNKAGNVWTDSTFPDSEAGKINREFKADFPTLQLPTLAAAVKGKIQTGLVRFYQETSGGYDADAKDKMRQKLRNAMA